ncbi:DUF6515 family protein [Povalibacter sp.]|uniref:DUF6515 family protein n=1 Tax=Povalibacter sp. TaxID=1962978 RepID=UPI002F41E151
MNDRKHFSASSRSTRSRKPLAAYPASHMIVWTIIFLFVAAAVASAAEHGGGDRGQPHGGGQGHFGGGAQPHFETHMDGRFSHNRHYYNHGQTVHDIPRGGIDIHHGGQHYWYDRGHWYRRHNGISVVIGAPLGAFVPLLPYYYSTIWWGGVPYYYANDTYYTWNGGQNEYEVVNPPAGIDSGGTTQAPYGDEVFIYPKNGQSADQQARDRYECYRSAADQTGYDPTAASGGVPSGQAVSKRSDYLRAQAACLDARGYSVK